MSSIVDPPPDGKTEQPALCGAFGGTVGIPPNTAEIRCELPVGHASQHYGTASLWTGQWGPRIGPNPWENH